jgi:hypothetical protein
MRNHMTPCFSIVGYFFYRVGILPLKCCLDSGHGGQTEDLDGDEDDGYDEGFSWPLDSDFALTDVC